ncbi:hypothetical protein Poli38472_010872 [Pythium oligandrum]|uniref:Uncharacterized protein n=1 Tax=Pythium oligandrum TaxID=41045 RepID=A0A8K1CE76_PYTOL|nr:hypothetical protein Poli38472_010872 [Pythium oligandrum]|eukprot:TMW61809.1 hypothetical protein Poli38472_010872 [Pythium oligandrum]
MVLSRKTFSTIALASVATFAALTSLVEARTDWLPTMNGLSVEDAWDEAKDYYEDALEAVDPRDQYEKIIGFDAFEDQIEADYKSGATRDQLNTKIADFVTKTEALIPGFQDVADKQMSRLEVYFKVKSGALSENSPDAQVLKQPSVDDTATTPWPTASASANSGTNTTSAPPAPTSTGSGSSNPSSPVTAPVPSSPVSPTPAPSSAPTYLLISVTTAAVMVTAAGSVM